MRPEDRLTHLLAGCTIAVCGMISTFLFWGHPVLMVLAAMLTSLGMLWAIVMGHLPIVALQLFFWARAEVRLLRDPDPRARIGRKARRNGVPTIEFDAAVRFAREFDAHFSWSIDADHDVWLLNTNPNRCGWVFGHGRTRAIIIDPRWLEPLDVQNRATPFELDWPEDIHDKLAQAPVSER